jgi:SAM-dependent methyltransferase
VTASRRIDPIQASKIGGRTLEVFADTPRLNRWLYSKLQPDVRGEVLEIGSGIGNLSRLIVDDAERVIVSDMELHYIDELRRIFATNDRVDVVRYDLDASPPAEITARPFDTIVAVNVVEHIADDHAAVATLSGLLSPGGKLVVWVPACPFAYGSLDRALGHYRRYTPATLADLLLGAGLRPGVPRYMNFFGLLGWALSSRVLRRERLSAQQIALFERLVPLFRLEDRIRLPVGLGLYAAGEKPGGRSPVPAEPSSF